MNINTRIHATIRMYLQSYERRFEDPQLLQRWSERANAVYRDTYRTNLSGSYVREHLLFRMANADTDYFFIEDLRKYFKSLNTARV